MSAEQEINRPSSTQDFQRLKTLVEQSTSTSQRYKLGRQLTELNKLSVQGKDISVRWEKWHSALLKNQLQIEKRRQIPNLFLAYLQRYL